MNKNLVRLISFICVLNIFMFSFPTCTLSLVIPEDALNWSRSTSKGMKDYTYFEEIIGYINERYIEMEAEFSNSSDQDVLKIVSDFSKILIYMDWVTKNIYVDETTREAYTLFNMPVGTDGNLLIDTVKSSDVMQNILTFYNLFSSSGVLNSTWSVENTNNILVNDSGSILNHRLTLDGTGSNRLLGDSQYRDMLQDIMKYYCDYHILAILAQELDDNQLKSISSGEELATICDSTFQLEEEENVAKLVTQYKEQLRKYTDLYNDIISLNYTVMGVSLKDVKVGETQYLGYYYNLSNYQALDYYVSNTTKAIHKYMYSSSSNVLEPKVELPEAVDLEDGALFLMSNARIQNGQIVVDGDVAELKNIGYSILAAGAVYDPFVSKAGNDLFIETVEGFLSNESQKDELKQILQVAINTKKPLYVTDISRSKAVKMAVSSFTGGDLIKSSLEYRMATLEDALQINESVSRVYTVVRGQMKPSSVDNSTWEYSNQGIGGNIKENNTTEGIIAQSMDTSGSVATNTTAKKEETSENKGVITVGSEKMAANDQQMTLPVMITSGKKEGLIASVKDAFTPVYSQGGLTSLILHNASVDCRNNKVIKNASKELLFINGLGDIVLADNTIVLPAIANPLLYGYSEDYNISDKDFAQRFVSDSTVNAYYPYTAAFMNHYPTARINSSGNLEVSAETDDNKYIIIVDDYETYAKRLTETGKAAKVTSTNGVKIAPIAGASFNVTNDPSEIYSILALGSGSASSSFWRAVGKVEGGAAVALGGAVTYFGGWTGVGTVAGAGIASWGVGKVVDEDKETFITRCQALNSDGMYFFPLTSEQNIGTERNKLSGAIVTSALRHISSNKEDNINKESNGRFFVDVYILNLCGEALLGNQYASTMVKNYQVSYDDIVADSGNRLLRFLVGICDSALDNLGTIDGVVSLKGPYQNGFFNAIVLFVRKFYLLIAVALMIIVAAKFLKGHYNTIYVCFIGFLCICGFEIYANLIPTMIPTLYNFFVNDISEQTVWNSIIYKAESYDETYKDSNRVDTVTGIPKPYTATITLYTLSNYEMDLVGGRVGVSRDEIDKGIPVYLDASAGIFLQGNEIRMSIDKLFVNNSIRGLYQSQWESIDILGEDENNRLPVISGDEIGNNNPYSLQLTSAYVSLETYYTPFCHIERAFIQNLNNFSSIFKVERNTNNYNGELYKDAFLVSAFIKSGIVTAPGNDTVLRNNIMTRSVTGTPLTTVDDLIEKCNILFELKNEAVKNDWLNLRVIFANPDEGIKNSLWGLAMQKKGWYDKHWNITELGAEKIADMINYIDSQTLYWVVNNIENLMFCSDENIIKLISLYATTSFTHYVSDIGEWLYPNYVNSADIQLKDVLYGSMTTTFDRNYANDGTITNTVATNLGIFGILFLFFIIIFSTFFIFIVTYMIPILYCLFGGILIYRLVNDQSGIGVVKGYTKITLFTAVLYIVFNMSMNLVRVGSYNWYGYLGCAIVCYFCDYFILWAVVSVIQDAGELGNNTLSKNLIESLQRLTKGRIGNFHLNNANIYNRRGYGYGGYGRGVGMFRRGYNIDNYDAPLYGGFLRRRRNNRRYYDFDDNGYDGTRRNFLRRFFR